MHRNAGNNRDCSHATALLPKPPSACVMKTPKPPPSNRKTIRLSPLAALRGRRGMTATEFGLVASAAILLLIAIMEAAIQLATAAALDWAALRASRFGMTGGTTVRGSTSGDNVPTCRSAIIPWLVTYRTAGFLNSANLTVTTTVYSSLSTGRAGTGGTTGAGTGGAIIGYQLNYTRPFITPLAAIVTGSSSITHRATLLIKNEPFDNATC